MTIEVNNFDLKSTILSGACFRVTEEKDGSFTNILNDRVINIKQNNNLLTVKSNNYDNIELIIKEYFDLNRDYNKINNKLIKNDKQMINIIPKVEGYKIINQDSFEMCISYIISQNNNVKRISKSIEELSKRYGKEIEFNDNKYYLFPKYEDLINVTQEEFKSLGVGFRDKYLVDFIQKYKSLKDINTLSTEDALKELMKVKGIGLKVASCILLFGYKRLDVYPIDTWVKQCIKENYGIKDDQKTIEEFAKKTYKEYSGLAIQYLYHSQRNIE